MNLLTVQINNVDDLKKPFNLNIIFSHETRHTNNFRIKNQPLRYLKMFSNEGGSKEEHSICASIHLLISETSGA